MSYTTLPGRSTADGTARLALRWGLLLLGAWVAVSPLALGPTDRVALHAVAGGSIVLVAGLYALASALGDRVRFVSAWMPAVAGLVVAAAALADGAGGALFWSDVASGALAAAVGGYGAVVARRG